MLQNLFLVLILCSVASQAQDINCGENSTISKFSYTMKSDGIKTVQIYHNLPTYRPVNVVSGSSIVFDFTTSSSVAGPWFRDVVPSASYSSSVASFTIGVSNAKQNNQQVVESAASSSIMSSGFIVVAVLAMLGIFSVPRGSIAVYALCALFLASVVVAQTCNITEITLTVPSTVQQFCENANCRCVNGWSGVDCTVPAPVKGVTPSSTKADVASTTSTSRAGVNPSSTNAAETPSTIEDVKTSSTTSSTTKKGRTTSTTSTTSSTSSTSAPATKEPEPAPEPEQPAPEPEQPAPEPEQPAPEPEQPAPEPEQPAPEPEQPAPEPEQPAPEPEQPAQDPEVTPEQQ